MPNVSMPDTASASRMIRLMACTSGMSTWPGSFDSRNRSTLSTRTSFAADAAILVDAAQKIDVLPHLVIEHRDVAGGHVGDDDVVVVLVELAEDAAHRDDVVVGMRREADDDLRQLALPRTFEISALNTSPLSGPADPYRASSEEVVLAVIERVELENAISDSLNQMTAPPRARVSTRPLE